MGRHEYQVIAGNVGNVYDGHNCRDANRVYQKYIEISENEPGNRAYGEDVAIMKDGEQFGDHIGRISRVDHYAEEFMEGPDGQRDRVADIIVEAERRFVIAWVIQRMMLKEASFDMINRFTMAIERAEMKSTA